MIIIMVNLTRSNRPSGRSRSVRRKTVIKLGRADSIAFVESWHSPPELRENAPLARAILRYKQSQEMG